MSGEKRTFQGMQQQVLRSEPPVTSTQQYKICSSQQAFGGPIEELAFDSNHRRVASVSREGIKIYEIDNQGMGQGSDFQFAKQNGLNNPLKATSLK